MVFWCFFFCLFFCFVFVLFFEHEQVVNKVQHNHYNELCEDEHYSNDRDHEKTELNKFVKQNNSFIFTRNRLWTKSSTITTVNNVRMSKTAMMLKVIKTKNVCHHKWWTWYTKTLTTFWTCCIQNDAVEPDCERRKPNKSNEQTKLHSDDETTSAVLNLIQSDYHEDRNIIQQVIVGRIATQYLPFLK